MKILFPVLCVALLLTNSACGSSKSPTDPSQVSGVSYSQTDLVVGNGKVAAPGATVSVNYTVWLYNAAGTDNKGTQVDTSIGKAPFSFLLGFGGAVKGFDQGVTGMAVGGKRRLIVPPSLAYGSSGSGSIPPNANLVFEVELLNVT